MPATERLPQSDEKGWAALSADETLDALESTREGLAAPEAASRLARFGPNRLATATRRGPLKRLLAQFNLLIYVLIAAAALSALTGHTIDAAVILAVIVVNTGIGFFQEGKAEDALEAIRGMIDPEASVRRDGHRTTVRAEDVVPGDVVLIEAGDRVPADLRLIRARNLKLDEAALTGESVPVDKSVEAVAAARRSRRPQQPGLFGHHRRCFGQGIGVAVATGTRTELGRISGMLAHVIELKTPLVRQMDRFTRHITFAVLAAAIIVFAIAFWLRGFALAEAFMAVVSLFVAAIPEGLPAVMTITLAIGVQRMAGHNAIIRRLPAVETLGAVSVICSDKTGTLTRNEMVVRSVATADGDVEVSGTGYVPEGTLTRDGREVTSRHLADACRHSRCGDVLQRCGNRRRESRFCLAIRWRRRCWCWR